MQRQAPRTCRCTRDGRRCCLDASDRSSRSLKTRIAWDDGALDEDWKQSTRARRLLVRFGTLLALQRRPRWHYRGVLCSTLRDGINRIDPDRSVRSDEIQVSDLFNHSAGGLVVRRAVKRRGRSRTGNRPCVDHARSPQPSALAHDSIKATSAARLPLRVSCVRPSTAARRSHPLPLAPETNLLAQCTPALRVL